MINIDKVVLINENCCIVYDISTKNITNLNELNFNKFEKILKNQTVYIVMNDNYNQDYDHHKIPDQLNVFEKIQWKKHIENNNNDSYTKVMGNDNEYFFSQSIHLNVGLKFIQNISIQNNARILGLFSYSQIVQSLVYDFLSAKNLVQKDLFYLLILEIHSDYYQHFLCKNGFICMQRLFEKSQDKTVFRDFIIDNDVYETIKYANQEIETIEYIGENMKIFYITNEECNSNDVTCNVLANFHKISAENFQDMVVFALLKYSSRMVSFQKTSATVLNIFAKYKNHITTFVCGLIFCFTACELYKNEISIHQLQSDLVDIQNKNQEMQMDVKLPIDKICALLSIDAKFIKSMKDLEVIMQKLLRHISNGIKIQSVQITNNLSDISINILCDNSLEIENFFYSLQSEYKIVDIAYINNMQVIKVKV